LEWLNQRLDTNFFGVSVEVFQIDDGNLGLPWFCRHLIE
jgi:hypothetical protein